MDIERKNDCKTKAALNDQKAQIQALADELEESQNTIMKLQKIIEYADKRINSILEAQK